MKRYYPLCLIGSFCILTLCFPQIAMESAREAMSLWAVSVVPALFSFSTAISLLISLRILNPLSQLLQPLTRKIFGFDGHFSYLFLSSALSGYPIGAKLTTDLYRQHQLSKNQAEMLLSCVSTSGPMFILGSVCMGMLGSASYSIYLLWPHYLSALCICLITGRRYRHTEHAEQLSKPAFSLSPTTTSDFGSAFAEAATSCIKSMLLVCGFMIIYAVYTSTIVQLLQKFHLSAPACKVILGLLEMTTGCTNSAIFPLPTRLIYLSFLISFGGISIYSQTTALAASAGLRARHFLIHKSIQGILSAAFTALLLRIIPLDASCSSTIPTVLLPAFKTTFLWFLPLGILCLWLIFYFAFMQKTSH